MVSPDEESQPDFSFLGGASSGDASADEKPALNRFGEVPDGGVPEPEGVADMLPATEETGDSPEVRVPDFSIPEPASSAVMDRVPAVSDVPEKVVVEQHGDKSAASRKSPQGARIEFDSEQVEPITTAPGLGPQKLFLAVAGYAIAVTLLILFLLATGRLSFIPQHPLESLPDIEPLQNSEFREFTTEAAGNGIVSLPDQHALKLGETRRFGDVEVTPVKVTREHLWGENAETTSEPEQRTEAPVLLLWLKFRNVSLDSKFAPWDARLMCHRFPEYGIDDATKANSWLLVEGPDSQETRVLNYLHAVNSPWMLTRQNSGMQIAPGAAMTTYVASSEEIRLVPRKSLQDLRWRIQFRKGVSPSGHGVTTLIDVNFSAEEIQDQT